jgi:hypothetical protein
MAVEGEVEPLLRQRQVHRRPLPGAGVRRLRLLRAPRARTNAPHKTALLCETLSALNRPGRARAVTVRGPAEANGRCMETWGSVALPLQRWRRRISSQLRCKVDDGRQDTATIKAAEPHRDRRRGRRRDGRGGVQQQLAVRLGQVRPHLG